MEGAYTDWQDIIKAKYLERDSVATVKSKFSDSPIWKAIMKVKEHYMARREVVLGSGNIARLWFDSLNGNQPLYVRFPELFVICNLQNITVDKWHSININDFFRRGLNPILASQWGELCSFVNRLNTSSDPDRVVWALGPKKIFTTKSMYEFLERNIAGCDFKWIWRAKIPSKIQIFFWQLF